MEQLLFVICYHASATLVGVKPANLLNFRDGCSGNYQTIWHQYRTDIERILPVSCYLLSDGEKGCRVLFYNSKMLREMLEQAAVKRQLSRLNYRVDEDLNSLLAQLQQRFTEAVPNEIGIFLGYPLTDFLAFMNHQPNSLFTGYWKVFSNPDQAKLSFALFDRARQRFEKALLCGNSPSRYLQNLHA